MQQHQWIFSTIGQKAIATTSRSQFVKDADEPQSVSQVPPAMPMPTEVYEIGEGTPPEVSTHSPKPKPKPKHLGGEQILHSLGVCRQIIYIISIKGVALAEIAFL